MTAPTDPNLFILPRPDGRRVAHLGKLALPLPFPADNDPNLARHIGPYTDGAINVPAHYWHSEVTDFANAPPIKIVNSPAALVTAHRMFAYGDTGIPLQKQPPRVPYAQMGSSNITIGMPQTGGRPDIGLTTDNSAYFMLGFDPNPMIDWAMAAGSCPMHFRDEATGKPVDLLKWPLANCNDRPGYGPWIARGPYKIDTKTGLPTLYTQSGGTWDIQQGHWPELSYVAFEATENFGFLEDLQYATNFTVLCDAAVSYHLNQAVPHGEYRGVAWALRNLFMCHAATQKAEAICKAKGVPLPNNLHPSSYYKTILDNSLGFYSLSMTNPQRQVFRNVSDLVTAGTANGLVIAPWQCDYMLTALAFGVLTGHSDWTPLYLWALKNAYDRTSGDDLPLGYCDPYYIDASQPNWKAAMIAGVPGLGGAEPATPAELAALAADPYNKGVALRGIYYLDGTRAALVQAQYLHMKGIDIKTTYPKLDICVQNADRMLQSAAKDPLIKLQMEPRFAIVLDATGVPATVPPLTPPPVVTPPPSTSGTLHMTGNGIIAVGQTVPFVFDYDDGKVPPGPTQSPVNLVFTVTPHGAVTVDPVGKTVTGGPAPVTSYRIDATADNFTPASLQGSVSLPLGGALHLRWG